jgi:hypothetical protein
MTSYEVVNERYTLPPNNRIRFSLSQDSGPLDATEHCNYPLIRNNILPLSGSLVTIECCNYLLMSRVRFSLCLAL